MTLSADEYELVVVTGTTSGIGRATAQRLARDGYHVLAGVRRKEDAAQLDDANIEPVLLDITDEAALSALADRVAGDPAGRRLRAVVNNAGIAVNAPVETAPLDEWRRQFEVGVIGQIAVTQALIPALLTSGGRVVNIGSLGGKVAMPGFGPYSAAKFAMEAVNDTLRREVEPLGVKVVIVTPGSVRTTMSARGITTATRLAESMTPDQHARYDRLVDAFGRSRGCSDDPHGALHPRPTPRPHAAARWVCTERGIGLRSRTCSGRPLRCRGLDISELGPGRARLRMGGLAARSLHGSDRRRRARGLHSHCPRRGFAQREFRRP